MRSVGETSNIVCDITHRVVDLHLDSTAWRADVSRGCGKSPCLIWILDRLIKVAPSRLPYKEIVVWLARTTTSALLEIRPLWMKSRDICWFVSGSQSRDRIVWVQRRSTHSDLICWQVRHWLLWSFWSLAADWRNQTARTFVSGSVCTVMAVAWQVSPRASQQVRCCYWTQSACCPLLHASSCAPCQWTRRLVWPCHRAFQFHSATTAGPVSAWKTSQGQQYIRARAPPYLREQRHLQHAPMLDRAWRDKTAVKWSCICSQCPVSTWLDVSCTDTLFQYVPCTHQCRVWWTAAKGTPSWGDRRWDKSARRACTTRRRNWPRTEQVSNAQHYHRGTYDLRFGGEQQGVELGLILGC